MRPATIELLRKFWRLSWQDRLLLLEAFLWLALAAFAIAVLSFRQIAFLAARPIRQAKLPTQVRLLKLKRIRWAIVTAGGKVPWHVKCFQQGFAAQIMLRRRGVPSVLYYGAAQDDKSGLLTHVWVRDGDVDVVGGETAYRFTTLATFPPSHDGKSGSHRNP
jgi:hypothetical protein